MNDQIMRGPADPDNFRQQVGRYGDRFYVDNLPTTGSGIVIPEHHRNNPIPSVSAIKGAYPKFLTKWAATESAKYAVQNKDAWLGLEDDAAVDLISNASDRIKNRAARRGSMIHLLIEDLSVGKRPDFETMPDNVTPFIGCAEKMVYDLQLKPIVTEAVVFNHLIGYGGTFDMIADSVLGRGLFDWKTRKAPQPYDEEACQGAGYLGGEYMIVEDMNGHPVRRLIPDVDFLAIVVLAPDVYKVHEINEEKAWNVWTSLAAFWHAKMGGGFYDGVMPVKSGPQITRANIVERIKALSMNAKQFLANTWPADLPTVKQGPTMSDLIRIEKHLAGVEAKASAGFNFLPPADECGQNRSLCEATQVFRAMQLTANQQGAVTQFIHSAMPGVAFGTTMNTNRRGQIHRALGFLSLYYDGNTERMASVLPNELGFMGHDAAKAIADEYEELLAVEESSTLFTTESGNDNE